MKRIAINIGLLSTSLLFVVLCLEVFLRVSRIELMSDPKVHLHQSSSIGGLVYELIPGIKIAGFGWETIEINAQGFRSPERDATKPVIAMVGDSYTFGHGVNNDETNPAYLQEHFPNAYVLNAGVDGYNIEQEAITYVRRLARLNPSVVVVEFVFNDFTPKGYVNPDGTIFVGQGTLEEQAKIVEKAITKKGLINFPGKVWLEHNSAVFNFVERKTKWLPFRTHSVDTTETVTDEQLRFYAKWFATLDNAVETKHKIFVIWPESNSHETSRATLRKLAEDRGYTVIDLYDTLGNGYKSLGWDYHPKAHVHKEVADLMAKVIREKKMLP